MKGEKNKISVLDCKTIKQVIKVLKEEKSIVKFPEPIRAKLEKFLAETNNLSEFMQKVLTLNLDEKYNFFILGYLMGADTVAKQCIKCQTEQVPQPIVLVPAQIIPIQQNEKNAG